MTKNLEEAYAQLDDQPNAEKYKLVNLQLKDSIAYNKAMAVNKTLSKKKKILISCLLQATKCLTGLLQPALFWFLF